MLKITHWSPDTCGCTISYSWDDSVSEDKRVHTYCSPIQATKLRPDAWKADALGVINHAKFGHPFGETVCEKHKGLSGEKLYNVLLKENQAKNKAISGG